VREYGLARSEGVLLRYLTDAYKTLVQTVPEPAKTDAVIDVIAYLRALLERIDSSLVTEWESLVAPPPGSATPDMPAAAVRDITKNPKEFAARIRHELHALVRALASRDAEEAAACVHPESPLTVQDLERAIERYFAEYPALVIDASSRAVDCTQLEPLESGLYRVRHTLVDPEGDRLWYAQGIIDLREDRAPEGVLVRLEHLGT